MIGIPFIYNLDKKEITGQMVMVGVKEGIITIVAENGRYLFN